MADEETEEGGGKAKSPMLMILIAALLALGIGLGVGFVLFKPADAPPPAEGEEVAESAEAPAEEEKDETVADFQSRTLNLDPVIVNIQGDGYTRLLKMTIALECESGEVRDEAEGRMAQIRDSTLTLVSSKRLVDLTDFEGKVLLKEEIRNRVDQLLTTGQVKSVLLTEFVVQ